MTTKTLKTQEKLVIKHRGKYRLVAKLGNHEAGRLYFSVESNETKRAISLEWVEVYPKYRGRGIGQALLRYFIKEIKEKFPNVIWISAATGREIEENEGHEIYKTVGFKLLAVQRDYYAPGVHCHLYVKKIRPGKIETMGERARHLRIARRIENRLRHEKQDRLSRGVKKTGTMRESKRRKKEIAKLSTKGTQVTKKAKKVYSKSRVRVPAYASVSARR